MKKFMKVAALVLVATLLVSCFAACGTKTDDKKDDGKTNATGEILIGATGPLTGDASSYGISVKNGAEIAIEEINAAGGLNGITFKFEMKDDKASAADAATAYDGLMDAGMKVSLGSVTSGSCEAFAGAAEEDNLFFITPSASAANVITYGTNVKEVTTQVTEASVDCGVVYCTDAFSAGLKVVDEATKEMCGQVIYPAAVLKAALNAVAARKFLEYLQTSAAGEVFESVGFTAL